MLDTPQFIQTDEQLTAVIHLTVPRAEISHVMGPAITEIMSTIAAQGATITGPCFSYHQKRPTDTFDFEVGFPVSQANHCRRSREDEQIACRKNRPHYLSRWI